MAVHVGSGHEKKVWNLPEKLLKSNSTFFTAALQSGFAEGISKNITLPEEDPDMFQWFVAWLYTGYDAIRIAELGEQDLLVPFWTLGDRLGCPLMQDDAMGNLIEYHDECQLEDVILKQIYEGSTRGSKLRLFAVDQCLFDVRNHALWSEKSYSQFVKENEDFAQELAEATILLGEGDPKNPLNDMSPYLFASSTSETSSEN